MGDLSQGTVLTCSHGHCGCRVVIESECHCPGSGVSYTCTCGAPLVELTDDGAETAAHD
jgi:hypothetical protein